MLQVLLRMPLCMVGWGCILGEARTGKSRSPDEKSKHINYLELLAVYLALQCFTPQVTGKHVKVIMVDNMTALSDINHMGAGKCKDRHQLISTSQRYLARWKTRTCGLRTVLRTADCGQRTADMQIRKFLTCSHFPL